MQTINLLFEYGNINNPFTINESDCYIDIHTSQFYLETMKQKHINQETDLLVLIKKGWNSTRQIWKVIPSSSFNDINDIQ